MNSINNDLSNDDTALGKRLAALDDATRAMSETRDFGKHLKLRWVLDSVRRVMLQPGGCAAVQSRAAALEDRASAQPGRHQLGAGCFVGQIVHDRFSVFLMIGFDRT